MKHYLSIALITTLICGFSLAEFQPPKVLTSIEDVAGLFRSGSSKDLARFFDSGIDININGNHGDYSRNQAELVMRDFFKKYPPEDFQLVHRGNNSEPLVYYIGNYKSETCLFRIFIKGKKQDELIKIFSMDIVKE